MQQIDTRGLSCPEPVIRTKRFIHSMEPGAEAQILVGTGAACENVLREVRKLGCDASVAVFENDFCITIIK